MNLLLKSSSSQFKDSKIPNKKPRSSLIFPTKCRRRNINNHISKVIVYPRGKPSKIRQGTMHQCINYRMVKPTTSLSSVFLICEGEHPPSVAPSSCHLQCAAALCCFPAPLERTGSIPRWPRQGNKYLFPGKSRMLTQEGRKIIIISQESLRRWENAVCQDNLQGPPKVREEVII